MAKKRRPQEATVETDLAVEIPANPTSAIKANLEKIKDEEGMIGYILRNTKLASIDLKDPSKLIDYAMLSSSMFETAEELATLFSLGAIKQVYLEGEEAKVLSITMGENRLNLFTDHKANPRDIAKKIV